MPERSRLGEILVRNGSITQSQLDHALAQQKELKLPLGKTLLKLNYLSDEAMRQALSLQLNVPYLDLDKFAIDRSLGKVIARSYARKYSLLPVAQIGRTLTVAMDDPTATAVVEELAKLTNHTITVVTASSKAIQQSMRRLYETGIDAVEVVATATVKAPAPEPARSPAALENHAGRRVDDPLHQIFAHALEIGASDIHLEPGRHSIRFRIDGVLREADAAALPRTLEKSLRELPARLRTLAGLDAADRVPQHGGFQIVDSRTRAPIGVRVSILPAATGGDSIVIRLADRAHAPKGLADLKLSAAVTSRLEALLQRRHGLLLVTGPTASGRSTTLAAAIAALHRPDARILIVDEPGGPPLPDVAQFDVRDEPGQTYADFLRVVLRHDPDVVLIGEIGDRDSAELACEIAEAGRLVLSALHAPAAVTVVPRLLDLGVAPSVLSSALVGVMAQRLVRRTCPHCYGNGCAACGATGFKGRAPIAELWTPDDADRQLILARAPFEELRRSAARNTHSFADDAKARVKEGITTAQEIARTLG
jgi:type IV pilus assembly protein PilB